MSEHNMGKRLEKLKTEVAAIAKKMEKAKHTEKAVEMQAFVAMLSRWQAEKWWADKVALKAEK